MACTRARLKRACTSFGFLSTSFWMVPTSFSTGTFSRSGRMYRAPAGGTNSRQTARPARAWRKVMIALLGDRVRAIVSATLRLGLLLAVIVPGLGWRRRDLGRRHAGREHHALQSGD